MKAKTFNTPDYGNRLIRKDGKARRPRSSVAVMDALRDAIKRVVDAMTVRINIRHIAYRLAGSLIGKDQYDMARVTDQARDMLEADELDYEKFTDETRPTFETPCWNDAKHFVEKVVEQYRTDFWNEWGKQVHVIAEKLGLSDILGIVTDRWLVPLHIARGYLGGVKAWQIGKRIVLNGKPATVLQIGDDDSDGRKATARNEAKVRKLAARYAARVGLPVPSMTFRRVAIQPEHTEQYKLIAHPQKPTEANRDFSGTGMATEVEAMRDEDLQELLRAALRELVPDEQELVPDEQVDLHEARDVELRQRLLRHMRRFRP
jgi:hypothetical protein